MFRHFSLCFFFHITIFDCLYLAIFSLGFYVHITLFFVYFFRVHHVQYTELIKKHFKNFLKLFWKVVSDWYQWRQAIEVSWLFSFINVVIIVSCFILYTFSFYSITCFMLTMYFIPSVILSIEFVKIMLDL